MAGFKCLCGDTCVSMASSQSKVKLPRMHGGHGAGVEGSVDLIFVVYAPTEARDGAGRWIAVWGPPIHREHAVAAKPTAPPHSVTSRWQ